MDKTKVVLEAKHMTKLFPGVRALSDVNIRLHYGEVLALIGENGAGKSTLIKMLSGVYACDQGEILLNGAPVRFSNPSDATDAGIGMIHQELNYVGSISVAENIFMGNIPKKGFMIDYPAMYAQARDIMRRVDVDIDPKRQIGSCSVAQKQLIEIAKVVSEKTKVLIMDEPTSALNEAETANMIAFVKKTAQSGISIIYISHRFDEIFEIADRVMVLRDGCNVGEMDIKDASKEKFIGLMAGRTLSERPPREKEKVGEIAIEVEGLQSSALRGISFFARRGEVLGVYGLLGSGHQNIGSAIFGQDILTGGSVRMDGESVKISAPPQAIAAGIAYVPGERKTEGLILNSSVKINIMASYYCKFRSRLVSAKRDRQISQKWIQRLRIKTPDMETRTDNLSGGNQQKVVLARWLELEPKVLILNEPTRGIDVGAKAEIYQILDDLCKEGLCIIMITSEMEELLTMSHRILVMHTGRITGMFEGSQITQDHVIRSAMGGTI